MDELTELQATLEAKQYDCECQVGGVDAMSIDTDWLNGVVDTLVERIAVLELAASGKDLVAAQEVVRHRGEMAILRAQVEKWKDPTYHGYRLGKTFFAEYMAEWLDGVAGYYRGALPDRRRG